MDLSRYYPNPALSNPSLLRESSALTWESAEQLVLRCLRQASHVVPTAPLGANAASSAPPTSSLGSLYVGELGLVYLRFRLSICFLQISSPLPLHSREELARQWRLEAIDLLEASTDFGQVARTRTKRFRRVTLLEGPEVGARALYAALLFHNGDLDRARQISTALIDQLDRSCRLLSKSECDVMYGRAGAIQTILWLRRELQDPEGGPS
jgi:hypothetical protein